MNNAYIRAQQLKVKEAKFPFVKIGTQYWNTKNLSLDVTPQGNTIPEMQANGNVEKIANVADREFSSDTGVWIKGTGWSISNGVAIKSNSTASILNHPYTPSNKWCKVIFTITAFTGTIAGVRGSFGGGYYPNAIGTYTIYLYGNTQFGFWSDGCSIDNVSVQEIGWAGSQELYDGIYAQTSGTVEQKTYAAVKAAAMWCNYNNDAPTGLIYGKLYNWFAVKLFQMDIDYYNAANPTNPYIWRMPTQAEFQTLSTYLGGAAVSGGHLKEAGLAHWNSPNTGADNSSGFCALGSGYRASAFGGLKFESPIANIDISSNTACLKIRLDSNNSNITLTNETKTTGLAIRLIKA